MDARHARPGYIARSNSTVVNEADGINDDGSRNTRQIGSNVAGQGPINISSGDVVVNGGIAISVTGSTGVVVIERLDGTSQSIPASLLPVGVIQPFTFRKIIKTGTTATGIWAWWGQ